MKSVGKFGALLKELRLREGYGLRRFAGLIEMPASNLSAIEHGRRSMPEDKMMLAGEVLGLNRGTAEWDRFFDLGRQSGQLPADIRQVAKRNFVPALLRTIDNRQLSDTEIQRLIKEIQQEHGGSSIQSG